MKALRWLGASLLGLVGSLLGLVGLVLCVTIVLAPLGIPILLVSRRLFRAAGALVVPGQVRHPLEAISESGSSAVDDLGSAVRKRGQRAKRRAAKATKRTKKRARKQAKKRL